MNELLQLYPSDRVAWIMTSVVLQTTLIFAAALLFAWCFTRHRPAMRHSVLACALLCCLVSPALTVIFDLSGIRLVELPLVSSEPRSSAALESETTTATATGVYSAPLPWTTLEDPFNEFPADEAIAPVARLPQHSGGRRSAAEWLVNSEHLRTASGAFVTIWLAVGLVLLGRLLLGWRVVSRIRRRSRPLTDTRVAAVLRSVVSSLGMSRAPVVACSAGISGPITVGAMRPVVLLPEALIDLVDDRELRHLLLHECAHSCGATV